MTLFNVGYTMWCDVRIGYIICNIGKIYELNEIVKKNLESRNDYQGRRQGV